MTSGYSGTPLPQKLGIKPGSRVLLRNAPASLVLDPLPDGTVVHDRVRRASYDVVLRFVTSRADLARRFPADAGRTTTSGAVWVCWPKRTATGADRVQSDLDENLVREVGLAAGLVDVKVCAVDATWSGLRFVRRLRDR